MKDSNVYGHPDSEYFIYGVKLLQSNTNHRTFIKLINNTEYTVKVLESENAKETVNDKIKKLIIRNSLEGCSSGGKKE